MEFSELKEKMKYKFLLIIKNPYFLLQAGWEEWSPALCSALPDFTGTKTKDGVNKVQVWL